jgi:DNA adenine methylase
MPTKLRYLRPAVKWHGGKHYLIRKGVILPLLPAHEIYVEPFGGGLNVLLNKQSAKVEIAGDLRGGLIDFYTVLRDQTTEFLARLSLVRYNRPTFDRALSYQPGSDAIENAVQFLIRYRFSRGALARSYAKSTRTRGGLPGDENAWRTIQAVLPRVAKRLEHVNLLHEDALEVIAQYDGPDTLFYCDPPYMPETRTARRAYGAYEMSRDDHERLLKVILACDGMVILSGYANPLYDLALASWERLEVNMPNHAGQGKNKQRRVEVIWLNLNCVRHSPAANQREFAW